MRKILFAGICLILFAGVSVADRATYEDTKTQIAMPLAEPPVIDGIIDFAGGESWVRAGGAYGATGGSYWYLSLDLNLEDEIRGGMVGDVGDPPFDDNDQSFQIYAGYDADNLYIAVRVVDDFTETDDAEANSANGSTWQDDSVEVFIDGDNSNYPDRDTSGTNAEVVGTGGQYVITANNAYREAEAGNPGFGEDAAWFAKTEWTDTGFDAEFRISMDTIGNPQPGDIIGFTVGVNDDDDGSTAERQMMWVGSPHTEITYGNLVIGKRTYTAPKTSAPTIDGVINADEYAGAPEIAVNPFTGVYDVTAGDDTWPVENHGFSAWIVHDDEAVYVAADVYDDAVVNDSAETGSEDGSTWYDDSVEIFFDPDDSDDTAGGGQPYEGQYVFTANGAWRDNEANNPMFGESDDWFAASSTTDNGYQIEFKITKFALIDPADGDTMGFHICINDDDDGGDRDSQMGWCGRAHTEWTYGDLTLSAEGGTSVLDWSIY